MNDNAQLFAWNSDTPAYHLEAIADVSVIAPRLSATRTAVSTRSGALRWIYANGITLHIAAGALPAGIHAAELRTTMLPSGRTALYALGDDARLYACDSAATRWHVVQEAVGTFDLLPYGAAVTTVD